MKTINAQEWRSIGESLKQRGYARIGNLLSKEECQSLIAGYNDSTRYRSVISMERYRFGSGEYKYFGYPLPETVQRLRDACYPPLAVIANGWSAEPSSSDYPENHSEFLERCHLANQKRPTPLILRYETGGYNTLHQDLYGEVYFPFQLVVVLTEPGTDHRGGEFVLTEQMPRAQSRATVLNPGSGDGVIFATNYRPVQGKRGIYKVRMKHGISEVTGGRRFAVGIIFHDAT